MWCNKVCNVRFWKKKKKKEDQSGRWWTLGCSCVHVGSAVDGRRHVAAEPCTCVRFNLQGVSPAMAWSGPPLSTPFVHLDATCAANCSGLALSKPSIGARCFPKPRPWTEGSITESSDTNQSCLSQLNCRRRRITTCMIPTARPPTLPNPSSPRSLQPPSPLRLTTRLRN